MSLTSVRTCKFTRIAQRRYMQARLHRKEVQNKVNLFVVFPRPGIVELGHDSCRIDVVTVVEVVIIVETMTEVLASIYECRAVGVTVAAVLDVAIEIAAAGHQTTPVRIIEQGCAG